MKIRTLHFNLVCINTYKYNIIHTDQIKHLLIVDHVFFHALTTFILHKAYLIKYEFA